MSTQEYFSDNFYLEMKRQSKTLKTVAAASGMSEKVLAKRLKNKCEWTIPQIIAVSNALGVQASDVLARATAKEALR